MPLELQSLQQRLASAFAPARPQNQRRQQQHPHEAALKAAAPYPMQALPLLQGQLWAHCLARQRVVHLPTHIEARPLAQAARRLNCQRWLLVLQEGQQTLEQQRQQWLGEAMRLRVKQHERARAHGRAGAYVNANAVRADLDLDPPLLQLSPALKTLSPAQTRMMCSMAALRRLRASMQLQDHVEAAALRRRSRSCVHSGSKRTWTVAAAQILRKAESDY